MSRPRAVIAIPARNEAEEIQACLAALAAQLQPPDALVLCLNNCTDETASRARAIAPSLPFALHPIEITLAGTAACAGAARRIAMDVAAALAGPHGVILTTDADARPEPNWLAANLAAVAAGAEAVAGIAVIEPLGAKRIPSHLHEADARECRYARLLDALAARLDADPVDPWPRHDEHSGASIAVTCAAYARAGGMPRATLGEDREFFAALRRVDARIRHAPACRVIVSARLAGRAAGGMADTIRRRIVCPDQFLDERLEPARDAARRAWLRGRARLAWQDRSVIPPVLAAQLGVAATDESLLRGERWFGTAWEKLQSRSSWLSRRLRVPVSALPAETARAEQILRRLSATAHPADMPLPATAEPA